MTLLRALAAIDKADAWATLAGLAAFVLLLAIWRSLVPAGGLGSRVAVLIRQREALQAGLRTPRRRTPLVDRRVLMDRLVRHFNLLRGREAEKIRVKLAHAGWRSKDVLVRYLFARLCLPLAGGVFAIVFCYGLNPQGWSSPVQLPVSAGIVLLAAIAPGLVVRNAIAKRRPRLQKGFPDALDLMVICAEAGLSLDSTFQRVARELEPATPEMADELHLASIELSFLPDRRQALENLALRTDLPSVRSLVNALMQTERYGTPLARALRVLAAEYRSERLLKAEEKAARLPATLTIPLIVFILPSLFVVLIGPAVLSVIDSLRAL